MITHEEAKELVDRIYGHTDTDWDTKDKLLAYISQQEKKDVLLGLYMANYKPTFEDVVDLEIEKLKKELGEMK